MNRIEKAILAVAAIIIATITVSMMVNAFSGSVEYKEILTTGATSSGGTTFQGDALVCCWNTTGGSFTGTVKLQMYHTLGATGSKGLWIDTGDTFTAAGCKVVTVPENGVKLRGYATIGAGSIRIRISQEYPPKVNNVGK
jgi:hypothetical protein